MVSGQTIGFATFSIEVNAGGLNSSHVPHPLMEILMRIMVNSSLLDDDQENDDDLFIMPVVTFDLPLWLKAVDIIQSKNLEVVSN